MGHFKLYIYALGEIENIVAGDEVKRLEGHEIYEWAGDGLQLAWAMEDSKVEAMVTRLVLRENNFDHAFKHLSVLYV